MSSPSPGVRTSSPAQPTPAGRRIDITVIGKQISPTPGTIDIALGESLTITVTSDHDDKLHAHGFEVEKDIQAGKQESFTVKGATTGVFDVELHEPPLRILQVAVR